MTPKRPVAEEDQQPKFATLCTGLATIIFENNRAKGFWDMGVKNRNFGEAIALAHGELSEALENHRKGGQPDDHLTQYPGWQVEIADCIIRLLDWCGAWNVPIGEIILAKVAYNKSRPHKHGKTY